MQFSLNANVHLNGARRTIVRIIHIAPRTKRALGPSGAIRQVLSNIGRIRRLQVEGSASGKLLLQGDKRGHGVADQRVGGSALSAADCSRGRATLSIYGPFTVCNSTGCPGAEQGPKNCRNAPVFSRGGPSKSTLFQIAFSKNRPIPPRIDVFPLLVGSQAKPTCGAKLYSAASPNCPIQGSAR